MASDSATPHSFADADGAPSDSILEGMDALTPLMERPEQPCAFVIFGASGDLTSRKLIPALYNLSCQDLLPPGFAIIGFAITAWDDESFRSQMRQWVKDSPEVLAFRPKLWDDFAPLLHYAAGDFTNPEGYEKLNARLRELDVEHGCGGSRVFYLATSPAFYAPIVANLDTSGLAGREAASGWTRIVVEKPFGRDSLSAQDLNNRLHDVFREEQIYRIDHYLVLFQQ